MAHSLTLLASLQNLHSFNESNSQYEASAFNKTTFSQNTDIQSFAFGIAPFPIHWEVYLTAWEGLPN